MPPSNLKPETKQALREKVKAMHEQLPKLEAEVAEAANQYESASGRLNAKTKELKTLRDSISAIKDDLGDKLSAEPSEIAKP